MTHSVIGGCLCGAVRFEAELASRKLSVCWCTQCMRQNSGPLVSTRRVRGHRFTAGTPATFRASDTATRGFCAACGSTLYWQADGAQPGFALGALDHRDGFQVADIVCPDTRPDCFTASVLPEGVAP